MPLQVVCPNPQCRKAILIRGEPAGKPLRCPACNSVLSVSPAGNRPTNRPTIHASSSARQGTLEAPSAQQGIPEPGAPAPKPAPGGRKEGLPAAIGPYRISRELGRGAFGVVYQGHDPRLERDVAIKVLNKDALNSARAVERFLREARVVAQMHHNHIVPVYELGEHEGCHYIASRFVPGKTLAALIPEEGMEPAQAVRLVLQLLEALAYAHEMGVLHRDIKPANAIVDARGHLSLMDFGLAGWVGQTEGRATQDGTVMGTPAYMPPEQARGDIQHLSAASDQYSAGVVLYELLTGRVPFEGGSVIAQLYNAMETPPPRPSEFRPGLDRQLETQCLRALAKKPEERFGSCHEFAEALRSWQAGRGSATAVAVPRVAEALPEVIPLRADRVPERETAVPAAEPPRRRKARRPRKTEASFAAVGGRWWLWLLTTAGGVAGVLLLCLAALLSAGVFRVATREGLSPPTMDTVVLDLGDGVKLTMVRIPAKGKTFWMGSPNYEKGRNPLRSPFDTEDQHEVELSRDYYLGVTEVTQAQYRAVMGTNPSFFCKEGRGRGKVAGLNTDDFPVEQVSWEEAREFCRKVGERLQDGQEYCLPTEAEWEYACRAGDSSKDSFPFYFKTGPTSSLSSGQINFRGNNPYGNGQMGTSLGRTARCGSFAEAVNAFGLYDMHGNVWEWCQDVFVDSRHVIRGGSWAASAGAEQCRASSRLLVEPAYRNSDIGLRLARASR